MNFRATILAPAAALVLGACNMLISPTPILSGDAAARPPLGLWLAVDNDCAVDTAGPASHWPVCSKWLIVRDDGTMTFSDDMGDDPKLQGIAVVYAAGNPALAEFKLEKPSDKVTVGYLYYGFEPDPKRPAGGPPQFTAWPVKCGPSQDKPYPGIESDCVPRTVAQIAAAAAASRGQDVTVLRWIREPRPGEEPRK